MESRPLCLKKSVVFQQLTLASIDKLDGLSAKDNNDRVVCYMPRGTKICIPINERKFLSDGIYAESAYDSHVRTFSSKPSGSRRVVREFGFFQLSLLMSDPVSYTHLRAH